MAYILKKITGTVTSIIPIAVSRLRIGRGAGNELHLGDLSVALDHAVIEQQGAAHVLTDLNKPPESYVNGNPVRSVPLNDGDRIRIGAWQITFLQGETAVLSMEAAEGAPAAIVLQAEVPQDLPAPQGSQGRPVQPVQIDYVSGYALLGGRFHPWAVSILGVLAVLFGMGGAVVKERPLAMPGPLSDGHALFARDCRECHATPWTPISEKPCLRCHAVGGHDQADPVSFPTKDCINCHREHRGPLLGARIKPTSVGNRACVACHGDLKAHAPRSLAAASIHDFGQDHPEFSIGLPMQGKTTQVSVVDAVVNQRDPGRLKMNHKLHLDPELTGLDERGPLTCTRCHLPQKGGLMQPVRFDPACIACHTLDFDPKQPDARIPHGQQPRDVDAWLRAFYRSQTTFEMEADSVEEMTQKAETRLFGKSRRKDTQGKCLECHIFDRSEGGIWVEERVPFPIASVQIRRPWFPKANFDHTPHGWLQCVACHTTAPRSETAKEILLPGIGLCRKCHLEEAETGRASAGADCGGCHRYHDRMPPPKMDGPHGLDGRLTLTLRK
jgi:hypothetical protein